PTVSALPRLRFPERGPTDRLGPPAYDPCEAGSFDGAALDAESTADRGPPHRRELHAPTINQPRNLERSLYGTPPNSNPANRRMFLQRFENRAQIRTMASRVTFCTLRKCLFSFPIQAMSNSFT